MKKVTVLLIVPFFILTGIAFSQCADEANIYSFSYDGNDYEIVKENKDWVDAAACAVERGGMLAEIDSQAEQDALYAELQNAGIVVANTVAADGGGASYVWLGGNDLAVEGTWIWDGNNDGTGNQFWQGTSSGSAVGGLYNNWGNEPDNWNGQDGLGLALTEWPLGSGSLGSAGQWNDINQANILYYVIEYEGSTGVQHSEKNMTPQEHSLYQNFPNPFNSTTTIKYKLLHSSDVTLTIYNLAGQKIETLVNGLKTEGEHQIEWIAEGLPSGIYYYRLQTGEFSETKQLILQK